MRAEIARLCAGLDNRLSRTRALMQEVCEATAEACAQEARQLAPVDSGELRRGIVADGARVVSLAKHSAFVELGSSRRKAQPFMRPAAERAKETFALSARRALEEVWK